MLIYVFALRSEVYCTIRFYNTERQLSSNCLKARHLIITTFAHAQTFGSSLN